MSHSTHRSGRATYEGTMSIYHRRPRRGLTHADTDKRFNDARYARNCYVRLQHSLTRYAVQ